MLQLTDFDYPLPTAAIAQKPATPRDHCRLLVFDRVHATWSHHFFYELPTILAAHHLQVSFVRNDSRVIPARLYGHKTTGGKVEIFLTKAAASTPHAQTWICLTKPALKPGQTVILDDAKHTAICSRIIDNYSKEITFPYNSEDFMQFLQEYGHTPIPPYIHSSLSEDQLRQDYQTIYAKAAGSVAAPTAGLHFTDRLTHELTAAGHEFIDLTLHVGLGTFLGVKTTDITKHHMHAEYYTVSPIALRQIIDCVRNHRPLLAVGTTATRTLESIYPRIFYGNNSLCPELDLSQPLTGDTSIFLYPPHRFHLTRHLLTNFHLPQSTLLMLVSAFASAPNAMYTFTSWSDSPLGRAYQDALTHNYRFFSFGDAMLIL